MQSQNRQFLESSIVSTGSDITHKVEIKEGISKTARMYLAKDIFCSIMSVGGVGAVDEAGYYIKHSYAIADMLIKEGGL